MKRKNLQLSGTKMSHDSIYQNWLIVNLIYSEKLSNVFLDHSVVYQQNLHRERTTQHVLYNNDRSIICSCRSINMQDGPETTPLLIYSAIIASMGGSKEGLHPPPS